MCEAGQARLTVLRGIVRLNQGAGNISVRILVVNTDDGFHIFPIVIIHIRPAGVR
jgi:hypothetical protein